MFGKSLLTVYNSHLAIHDLDKSFAELYLEWRAVSVPRFSPNRFERKSIASSEMDPKIMSWLGLPSNIEQIPLQS